MKRLKPFCVWFCVVVATSLVHQSFAAEGLATGLRLTAYSDSAFSQVCWERRVRDIGFDRLDDLARRYNVEEPKALRYSGYLNLARGGVYRLSGSVNDGVRVFIGGRQVLPAWVETGSSNPFLEDVTLPAGRHRLLIDYRRGDGRGKLAFTIDGPGSEALSLEELFLTASWTTMTLADQESFADPAKRVAGLRARYFSDADCSDLLFERRVDEISLKGKLVPKTDGDFGMEWIGVVRLPHDGSYQFKADYDDKLQVMIDGRAVIDRWGKRSGNKEVTMKLKAGDHPLQVRYGQTGKKFHVDLRWSGPGFTDEPLGVNHLWVSPWAGMQDLEPMLTFLFIGHSNLKGGAVAAVGPVHPRAWIWGDNGWHLPDASDTGAVRPFVAAMAEAFPGYRIGAGAVAQDGSRVKEHWGKGTRGFARAVDMAEQLQQHGHLVGVVSLLGWIEGGQSNEDIAAAFKLDFPDFITNLRQALKRSDLPWVASKAEWGRSAMNDEERKRRWLMVYNSFADLDKRVDKVVTVESKGCSLADGVHFDVEGYELWTERAVEAITKSKLLEPLLADLPVATVSTPLPSSATQDPITVSAELVRCSQAHTPESLGTYRKALVVHEYRVRKVHEGSWSGKRLLTVHWSVRNRRKQPAASYVEGAVHRLRCVPWSRKTNLHSLPLADDILALEEPLWFIEDAQKQ